MCLLLGQGRGLESSQSTLASGRDPGSIRREKPQSHLNGEGSL